MTQKFNRITLAERKQIYKLNEMGRGIRFIANNLGRSPSSIHDELHRGGKKPSEYDFAWAERNAKVLKDRNKRKNKIQGDLEQVILNHLLILRCSPQQISGRLKKLMPSSSEMHVSTETIYKYIYSSPKRAEICHFLRRKHKKRKKHQTTANKRGGIRNKTSIHKRPKEVQSREEFGHWEGDLIIGKDHKSAVGTIVERSTRFAFVVHLKGKDSKTVVNAFINKLSSLPSHMLKSLTYDQGTEMAEHERLTEKTGMKVYFADPGKPQQRGTNENFNGLLREYLPKKTDLSLFDEDDLEKVQNILNQRPKKVLDYFTPKEAFSWALKKASSCLSHFLSP